MRDHRMGPAGRSQRIVSRCGELWQVLMVITRIDEARDTRNSALPPAQVAAARGIPPSLFGIATRSRSSARAPPGGGLAVTCNLTLPVACVARASEAKPGEGLFEYSKYSGWPEVKESLMAGRIQAAYMLAPLVMDLADKKIPLRIVSLGHRSGAVIMVRSDSAYRAYKDLKGNASPYRAVSRSISCSCGGCWRGRA
jgi:hypothetical protein